MHMESCLPSIFNIKCNRLYAHRVAVKTCGNPDFYYAALF